jgi:hypothetical protein
LPDVADQAVRLARQIDPGLLAEFVMIEKIIAHNVRPHLGRNKRGADVERLLRICWIGITPRATAVKVTNLFLINTDTAGVVVGGVSGVIAPESSPAATVSGFMIEPIS